MLNKIKTYYLRFLFSGLFLLVFSGVFKLYYQDVDWAIKHQAEHFEEAINKVDKRLFKELEFYKRNIDSAGLESLLSGGVSYHKNLESHGIGIYVYNDENLKFWSTSKLIVPSFKSKNGIVKEGNGFYLREYIKENGVTIIAQFHIKKSYNFENSYIKNTFDSKLYLKEGWLVSLKKIDKGISIQLNSNSEFFFIKPSPLFELPHNVLLMTLELIGLISFLIGCILLAKTLSLVRKFIFFPGILILLRLCFWFIGGPINLHGLEIFNPQLLAFSRLVPSLGDLLLYVIFSLVLVFGLIKQTKFKVLKIKRFKLLFFLFGFSVIYFFTLLIIETVEGIVMYSKIPLDLSHILSIDYTSLLALFCIAVIISIYVLVCWKLIEFYAVLGLSFVKILGWFLILILGFTLVGFTLGSSDVFELLWVIPVFALLSFTYFENNRIISFTISISLLFIFSLMITQSLRFYTDKKTIDNKKQLLTKLAKEKDLVAEYLYQGIQKTIKNDEKALELVSDYSSSDQQIYKYFKKKYFNGFWERFDLQVNPCFDGDSILFVNESTAISCEHFFSGIINSVGNEVSNGFYYLENENGRISYLGLVEFSEKEKIFLEFDSKFKPNGVGFPTLLLDEQVERKSLNSEYGFAHFKSGELLKQKGSILYSKNISYYNLKSNDGWGYYEQDQIIHLVKRTNDDVYFLSEKITSKWDQMAFYSYLFAFFSILTILAILSYRFFYGSLNEGSSFKTRFQSIIIFILFFSTVFIGVGSVYYLKNQYNQKNFDAISEKIKSVQIEVEHKLGDNETIEKTDNDYTQHLLEKFSKVFFTDINIYNPNGKLIASSQNKIFDEGLVGKRMDPLAMYQMLFNAQSQFVQIEEIEGMQFLSAYVPFYNNDGNLLAYLNLPYFARSNDLKNEISDFIVALLNIYALLIVVALVIGLILTNKITEPLRLIQEKMANIQLGQSNEFINYKGKDEIGALVNEYNRMIIEITESAKRLAESEREDAWREMAKQVAHEIKNPLTPMKLSIQHLHMRWSSFDNVEKTERFGTFAQNLIQQIDTLSAIANEFSSFAKLPETSFSKIDLTEIISSSVDVYNGTDDVMVSFESDIALFVIGDKDQMLRVFNNLIKNAIQAIPNNKKGIVRVYTILENDLLKIIVEDNGKGISKDNYSRIFVPNFTTKTSGMGLGLAMVQKILENMGGTIYFLSEETKGTKFIIELSTK